MLLVACAAQHPPTNVCRLNTSEKRNNVDINRKNTEACECAPGGAALDSGVEDTDFAETACSGSVILHRDHGPSVAKKH